jgi:hypothetical protein
LIQGLRTSADALSLDKNEGRCGSAANEVRNNHTLGCGQLGLVEVGQVPVNSAAVASLLDLVGKQDRVLAGVDSSGVGAEGEKPDES